MGIALNIAAAWRTRGTARTRLVPLPNGWSLRVFERAGAVVGRVHLIRPHWHRVSWLDADGIAFRPRALEGLGGWQQAIEPDRVVPVLRDWVLDPFGMRLPHRYRCDVSEWGGRREPVLHLPANGDDLSVPVPLTVARALLDALDALAYP